MSDISTPASKAEAAEECVSRRPWGEVLSRSLKLFVFRAADEGGRSVGRILFFVFLGLLVIGVGAWALNAVTGWFEGLFDFWPFSRPAPEPEPEATKGWLWFRAEAEAAPVVEEERWICRKTPIC